MLKRLIIASIVSVCFIANAKAQTLKVSDVSSTDDKMYKSVSANALGQSLKLTIYDKSVEIEVPKEKPIFLRQVSDDEYAGVTEDNNSETWNTDIIVNTTLGVVTSATLTISVAEKGNLYRKASCIITAKRF